ncbi:MAG TPA: hypothetical protein DHV37_05710 [Erysipelotrichaceae bacterium]|nr:hypothetical protein [Erysipelotrichaceae bacterium]
MAKMGRPEIKISKEDFEKLCAMQCTLVEIAGFFDCSEDTIENWCKKTYRGQTFSEVYKRKSARGKISVRRKQFQVADAGNPTMLIWLGKQYLNQKEPRQELAVTNEVDDSIREMEEYFKSKSLEIDEE